MGGHALKNTYTERKNTEEFLKIGKEIQDKISYESVILKCYYSKADHGDLDLLVKLVPNLNIDWREYIQTAFNPNEIVKNDKVYSFNYQDFQIDFILINEESWEIAQTYGFWDPLGNIMGKTYHKFGLSYGWEGLFYKYRNAHGTNSHNILLTNDARRIFAFGGYDYDRYLKGFDTLEEIFRFAIDSTYFDAEMFKIENLKSLDKKRNRKRGSYHLFLNYIKDNGISNRYAFEEDKDIYLPDIDRAFPEVNLLEKLQQLIERDELQRALAEKFNGELVMEWVPDLKGKELGQAIGKFKDALGEDYDDFIRYSTNDEIYRKFMIVYHGGN